MFLDPAESTDLFLLQVVAAVIHPLHAHQSSSGFDLILFFCMAAATYALINDKARIVQGFRSCEHDRARRRMILQNVFCMGAGVKKKVPVMQHVSPACLWIAHTR